MCGIIISRGFGIICICGQSCNTLLIVFDIISDGLHDDSDPFLYAYGIVKFTHKQPFIRKVICIGRRFGRSEKINHHIRSVIILKRRNIETDYLSADRARIFKIRKLTVFMFACRYKMTVHKIDIQCQISEHILPETGCIQTQPCILNIFRIGINA